MRRRKKIALALLGLLLVSQAPFAYRRYQLGRLRASIAELNARRSPAPPEDPFADYAGVFHVHTALGGHSEGRPEEVVAAASALGLAFVVMTEHPAAGVNTAAETLRGTHAGVLFVNGSELLARGGERLFVVPGFDPPAPDPQEFQPLIERARTENRLAVIAYPEQLRDWNVRGYDAIEVYNLYTNARRINYARLLFDGLWSYGAYPDLLFATFYERPADNLRRWDEVNASGRARAAALAGNDAHANVGFDVGWPGGGGKLFGVRLDPYERSFSVVRNHVLLKKGEPLTPHSLLEALRAGRAYIGFDLFGDAGGFRFHAENSSGLRTLGEEIALPEGGTVRLRARAPVACRLLFFRDGEVVAEAEGVTEKELTVERAGVYRVEAYLRHPGGFLDANPWIISNPIYVK